MKTKTPLYATLLVFLVLFGLTAVAQLQKDYNVLEKYIRKAVKDFEVPGLAVGIIKNNEVVLLKGFGYRNTETKKKVDGNTVFGIASCSKAFTAATLAILVDEGKLDWDDKVIDYLPEFRVYDPYITRELTIRDLLCHRAGFQTFDGDLLWYGTRRSRDEVLSRIRYRPNEYSLREKFGYSNVMFIAASQVVEAVTGNSWDAFVNQRIFQPLRMNSTNTSTAVFDKGMDIASPHIDDKPEAFLNYDNTAGAAAINSSAADLLKWLQLMLDKGALGDTSVFSEKQYYTLVAQQTVLPAGPAEKIGGTHFSGYGLGWFLKDYNGRKVIGHGGGLPGFHSKVTFVPEDSLAYVILANQISGVVGALDRYILDFFVADSTRDWAALYLDYEKKQEIKKEDATKAREEARVKNTSPSLSPEAYTGTYEDRMYGQARVEMRDEGLFLTLLPTAGLFQSPMEHWHYDTFRIKFNDPFLPEGFVTFTLDEKGKANGFTIDLKNPDFHFYKLDFEKVD
ncbi:MAG: serine hydrolase [Bacteroidales bacterium]|nr:serine hydrolase [Bacteroidales bacterium]